MSDVAIDEATMADFDAFLAKEDVSELQRRIYRSAVRKMVNRLPKRVVRRELLTLRQVHRANRFDCYTPATAEAFEHFLKNGRKLKRGSTHQDAEPVLSADLISDVYRKQIIDSTLTFMKQIDADDVFAITEEDVEEYVEYHEDVHVLCRVRRGHRLQLLHPGRGRGFAEDTRLQFLGVGQSGGDRFHQDRERQPVPEGRDYG